MNLDDGYMGLIISFLLLYIFFEVFFKLKSKWISNCSKPLIDTLQNLHDLCTDMIHLSLLFPLLTTFQPLYWLFCFWTHMRSFLFFFRVFKLFCFFCLKCSSSKWFYGYSPSKHWGTNSNIASFENLSPTILAKESSMLKLNYNTLYRR